MSKEGQCEVQFFMEAVCPPHEKVHKCEIVFKNKEYPDSEIRLSGTGTFLDGSLVKFIIGNGEEE